MAMKVRVNEKIVNDLIEWIRQQVPMGNGAILGVSGGKDSTVALGLLCKALGANRVVGVLLPNGAQSDISDSEKICNFLEVKPLCVNIAGIYKNFVDLPKEYDTEDFTEESKINIAPRIRMTVLYALGQSLGCRVCGTGNASERLTGYFTKWGDGACDFNPLAQFTKSEVVEIGRILGLPEDLLVKVPADGLSGKTDEEKLGISYEDIDAYIDGKDVSSPEVAEKIRNRQKIAQHKLNPIPVFEFNNRV